MGAQCGNGTIKTTAGKDPFMQATSMPSMSGQMRTMSAPTGGMPNMTMGSSTASPAGMGFKDWRQANGMGGMGRGFNRALFNAGWQQGQGMPTGLNQRQQNRFNRLAGSMMPQPMQPMGGPNVVDPPRYPGMGGPGMPQPQMDPGFGNRPYPPGFTPPPPSGGIGDGMGPGPRIWQGGGAIHPDFVGTENNFPARNWGPPQVLGPSPQVRPMPMSSGANPYAGIMRQKLLADMTPEEQAYQRTQVMSAPNY